ncbi:hypothetical protein HZ326_27050 [Fusarium oxysporum f. sp. albedinis]|nr:hypothetical protein HZ326_27050 [Fusarium oxysporum f. sp. albedinis]KAK2468154.1 hypothetical protein H9L39_20376 [Fusarium oxysporum f. sp. albedinis]
MGDLRLLLPVLLLDACAVIIRLSSGTWSTQAKLSACLALGFVEPSSAIYDKPGQRVGYNPLVKEWNGPDSNLTATLDLVDPGYVPVFEKRRHIDMLAWATVVAAGGATIVAVESAINIYKQIADIIKSKANHNLCSMTTGSDSNGHIIEGYAYLATTMQ